PVADTSQTNGLVLRVTLSAAPPAGTTITFPASATVRPITNTVVASGPALFVRSDSTGAPLGTTLNIPSSSTPLAVYYVVATSTDQTAVEIADITTTVSVSGSATFPLGTANITGTVSLAPIGSALTSSGTVIAPASGGLIPRFAAAEVGPVTVLIVAGSSTT